MDFLATLTVTLSYPSGKIAVLVFAPYPGILAYLAYEVCTLYVCIMVVCMHICTHVYTVQDSDHPQVLAYVDELGRLSCCNTDGKIRSWEDCSSETMHLLTCACTHTHTHTHTSQASSHSLHRCGI